MTKIYRVYVPLNQWSVYEVEAANRQAAIDDVMHNKHGNETPAATVQLDNADTIFTERKEG